jgi:hypothetical protein
VSPDQYLPEGEPEMPEQAYVLDFVKTGYLAMGDQYRILHNVELDSEDPSDIWLVLESTSGGNILTVIPNEATTDSLLGLRSFDQVRFQKRSGIPYLELVT